MAFAANPAVAKNPHTFLTNVGGAGAPYAFAAQQQIATFFASDGATTVDPDGAGPRMWFQPVPEPKVVKNRVHLDLTSSAADRLQEIDRLVAFGARRVDIGQTGAESWTVLADPEGNEFCVVRPKETLIR